MIVYTSYFDDINVNYQPCQKEQLKMPEKSCYFLEE